MKPSTVQDTLGLVFQRMITCYAGNWNTRIDDWNWNAGVAVYGAVRAYEATGNPLYKKWLKAWLHKNAPRRIVGSVNTVIGAFAALCLHREDGDPEYSALCSEYADWCLGNAVRTTNGGFAHVWESGGLDDYRNQLWIDSLFMAGQFMLRFGVYDGRAALVEEGLRQFEIHLKCQFDEDQALFSHGYHCLEEKRLGAFWGRGNGWAAASMADLLEALRDSDHDLTYFRDVFIRQMDRAIGLKTESGMLRTLLPEEGAYEETTATALFGIAALKGYRLGILDERFLAWGRETVRATIGEIAENGQVLRASGGTDCQGRAGYLEVPYAETLFTYGIVLALMAEAAATEEARDGG